MRKRIDPYCDETHFIDGSPLSRTQRAIKKTREIVMDKANWLLATPILAGGLILGAGLFNENVLKREVFPLVSRDLNGDGQADPIVAFPIAGTDTDIVGYIDGKDMPKNYNYNTPGPVPFKTHITNLHRMGLIDRRFVGYPYSRPTTASLEDVDGNGKRDLVFKVWQEFPDYGAAEEVAKVFYDIDRK